MTSIIGFPTHIVDEVDRKIAEFVLIHPYCATDGLKNALLKHYCSYGIVPEIGVRKVQKAQ